VKRYFSSTYRDMVPFREFHRDTKHSSIYQDLQKTRHRDPSPPTVGSEQTPMAPN
jgi:hypothetical protein